ncbi:hypothetical protein BC828DRAFT_394513 [Blastocladiella britannica]|nr:hypothetical protein BC828DRAFT_394513 [Blastocladiella britannica]
MAPIPPPPPPLPPPPPMSMSAISHPGRSLATTGPAAGPTSLMYSTLSASAQHLESQRPAHLDPSSWDPTVDDVAAIPCHWGDCSRSFTDTDHLVTHLQDEHLPPPRRPAESNSTFKCMWAGCPRGGNPQTSRFALAAHVRSHTGDRPIDCPIADCDKSFTRADAMAKHVRSNHHDYVDVDGSGVHYEWLSPSVRREREEAAAATLAATYHHHHSHAHLPPPSASGGGTRGRGKGRPPRTAPALVASGDDDRSDTVDDDDAALSDVDDDAVIDGEEAIAQQFLDDEHLEAGGNSNGGGWATRAALMAERISMVQAAIDANTAAVDAQLRELAAMTASKDVLVDRVALWKVKRGGGAAVDSPSLSSAPPSPLP